MKLIQQERNQGEEKNNKEQKQKLIAGTTEFKKAKETENHLEAVVALSVIQKRKK